MESTTPTPESLASQLDCFTEEEYMVLSGLAAATARSHRKCGDGPPFIRFGKRVLYPKAQALEHFKRRSPEPRRVAAKEML